MIRYLELRTLLRLRKTWGAGRTRIDHDSLTALKLVHFHNSGIGYFFYRESALRLDLSIDYRRLNYLFWRLLLEGPSRLASIHTPFQRILHGLLLSDQLHCIRVVLMVLQPWNGIQPKRRLRWRRRRLRLFLIESTHLVLDLFYNYKFNSKIIRILGVSCGS